MRGLILVATAFLSATASAAPSSFSKAKNMLYKQVYSGWGETFYTGCQWEVTKGNKKVVDLNSCGLQNAFAKKHMKRAKRVEAEHVIPASWMLKKDGKWRQCVIDARIKGESPRKYCQTVDADYRNAHNDLINLVPSVGQVNANRSNKPFVDTQQGEFEGRYNEMRIYSRGVTPPDHRKGDIARIAFYMRDTYGVRYSKRMNALFKQWNTIDPMSSEERILWRKKGSFQ